MFAARQHRKRSKNVMIKFSLHLCSYHSVIYMYVCAYHFKRSTVYGIQRDYVLYFYKYQDTEDFLILRIVLDYYAFIDFF